MITRRTLIGGAGLFLVLFVGAWLLLPALSVVGR